MLLLLALATVVSGNVLPYMSYYPPYYHPYAPPPAVYHYPPRVYTHQYMSPPILHQQVPQPVVHQQKQQRAIPDDGFIYEKEPEGRFFLGQYKDADIGDGVGAGTLKGRVDVFQNPFIPDDGAYLSITLDDGIKRDVDYHLALVPATAIATACGTTAITTPANTVTTAQSIDTWTDAFLGATTSDTTYANLGVFRATGAIDPFKLKVGLNFHNIDGAGANFDAGSRYPSTFVTKFAADLNAYATTATTLAVTNTAVPAATRATASGLTLLVWELTDSGTAGGVFAAKTAGTFGCATIP